jgi:Sulfotransferase family
VTTRGAAGYPSPMFSERRLAWIFGSSRSGSTWLLRMLARAGDVVAIDDPHIGHHLGVWRPISLAFAAAGEEPKLATLDEIKRDKADYFFSDRYRDAWMPALRSMIATRFQAQADEIAERDRLAEPTIVVKEPGSQSTRLLLELFPASRMIFLLRDGRDVVDSWLDAYQRGSWAQREGAFPVDAEGRLALVRWLAAVWLYRTREVERAFALHDEASRVLVQYETLRQRPAEELGRIAELLHLDVTAETLERVAASERFSRVPESRRGAGRETRAAQPGAWRENLTSAEADALQRALGPKLRDLGYEVERRARIAA